MLRGKKNISIVITKRGDKNCLHFYVGIAGRTGSGVAELGAVVLAVLEVFPILLFGTDFAAGVGRFPAVPLGVPHPPAEAPVFPGELGVWVAARGALIVARV